MKLHVALLSAAAVAVVIVKATGALAAPPPWAHDHGYDHGYHYGHHYRGNEYYGYGYEPPVIVVQPAPVVEYPVVQEAPPFAGEPVREFTDQSGRYCREYQTEIYVGNRMQESYGTACRMPDGQWQVIN